MQIEAIDLRLRLRNWSHMQTKIEERFFTKPVNLYYMLAGSTLLLSLLGLIMVFSASSIDSLEDKGSTYAIAARQLLFLVFSIPMAWVLSRISLNHWKIIARSGVLLSVVMLLFVQIFGNSTSGNQNWLSLGFIVIQPSEFAKFLMILWAGYILAKQQASGRIHANVLLLIAPAFFLCMILILIGNDLGSASVFGFILVGLLWVSGLKLRAFGFVLSAGFFALAILVLTSPYRVQRFLAFVNPFAEDQYKLYGWQPAHSLLGLASGGFFGVGLGASRQKWGNLPEAHTDFIFSVIGEELGLFGTLATLFLISILLFSIFKIAMRAQDPMVRYVSSGIGCWIGIQTVLNIGSAISVLPVVGVTLPLLSYGGSSLIATFIAIGFVLGAARRDPKIYKELQATGNRWLQ
jgi:cell division protein FtsW